VRIVQSVEDLRHGLLAFKKTYYPARWVGRRGYRPLEQPREIPLQSFPRLLELDGKLSKKP